MKRLRDRLCAGVMCACILAMPTFAQEETPLWEKQGTFVAPDAGLSFAGRHQVFSTPSAGAPFDVISYKLDLTAAMVDENFGGKNLITLVLAAPADSLVLYQLNLQLDSVKVDGALTPFSVNNGAERFTVRLGAGRATGDTVHVEVAYRRIPGIPRPTDRRGYFYFKDTLSGLPATLGYTMSEPREARCWMPCLDEPWDKAAAVINVTIPAGFQAASNGRMLAVINNGNGTVTWRWREDHQIATYLMCVTISKWTIPTVTYVRGSNDSIPVQYFVWAADSVACAGYLSTVRQMLINLGALFGPYPWDKYAMAGVTPFGYGGMEHQTITTLHRSYETNEQVVVHELAHQWWGDLVTCGSWPDIWLNESFATYSEALWKESLGGFPALKGTMQSMTNFNYGSWSGAVYNPEGQNFGLFSQSVYSKGGWVLHTLRGAIGDSAFFRSLRTWRALFSEKSATTADFQSTVESVVGMDMSWFFNEWIYGRGWPVYALSSQWQGGTLFIKIRQQQPGDWPTFSMPIRIRAYKPGLDTTLVVWDTARVQTFPLRFGFRPDSIALDPDNWILKQRGVAGQDSWSEIPPAFSAPLNYPNPFNPGTTISYELPEVSSVRLQVFDLLGRDVATLVDGSQLVGKYAVLFDGHRLASGVYVYRLQIQPENGGPPQTFVRKMILAK